MITDVPPIEAFTRRGVLVAAGCLVGGVRADARAAAAAAGLGDVGASRVDLSSASRELKRLYGSEGAQLWSNGAASALQAVLEDAGRHGLDPRPYVALIERSVTHSERDLNLSTAALAYARALTHGVVNPSQIFEIYTLPRDDVDLVAGLKLAIQQRQIGSWLGTLAPQDSDYCVLSAAYVAFAGQSRSPDRPKIPSGPLIKLGSRDSRRPAVVAALSQELSSASSAGAPGVIWTADDEAFLRHFQRSRGLREDGVVGPNTLSLLNASPRDKARRLAVNLERLRWLQRSPPPTRIDVNSAASTLAYIVEGKVAWTTPVVPGRPGHETPQLQASFEQLVVNPPWNVPASIARREITPRGPAYLRRHHMRRVGSRIVQSPGPWAALGQVKFDMQNRYAIYLHDTPSKSLFLRSQRHLSHGCVRVAEAVAFARQLAAVSGQAARFDRLLTSGRTGVIQLFDIITVRLIYQTALVDDEGAVIFRPDVYGWDVRTAEAMGLTAPTQDGVERVVSAPLGP